MNLLSPGFLLAGVLLAGIPIVIHILNRRRYREQRWAAMEFLLRAMKKNRKRLRFEQWLLLAVRCLLLALLGLALSRPAGCDEGAMSGLARQSGLHVIVVDDSYSMAYEANRPDAATHLDKARAMARQLLDRMTPGGDAVEIITASAPARVVFAAGYDLDAARTALGCVEQSSAATDLAGALRLAAQSAREGTGATQADKRLHVLTDGTRSSLLRTTAGEGAGEGDSRIRDAAREAAGVFTGVTLHHLGLSDQQHAAVLDVGTASALVTARQSQELRATVRAFGGEVSRTVSWRLDDRVLPGGGEVRATEAVTPLTLSQVRFGRAGARVLAAELSPPGRLGVDSVRRRVVEASDRVRVLLVEGERGGGPLGSSGAFLRLALAPPAAASELAPRAGGAGATPSNSPIEPDVISDLELPNKILGEYRAIVLAGVPQVSEVTASALAAFVEGGGAVVIFMGEGVSLESYNASMLPRGLLPGALIKRVMSPSGGADARGFTLAFDPQGNLHPLLGLFRGESRTGLETAEVFTYIQTELATPATSGGATTAPARARVERVLDFAGGRGGAGAADAAITAHSLGRGRVVFVATSSGADGWTTLPARPVFVPLVQELVGGSLASRDAWMNLTVGERLELPNWLRLAGQPALADAAGRTYPLISETIPEGVTSRTVWRSEPLTRPGVFVLTGASEEAGGVAGAASSLPVVVNVDAAAEADVRTLDDAAVGRALGDLPNVEVLRDQLPPERVDEASRGADFGWSVMLIVLAFVGLESFLAMRFGHSR